MEIKDHKFLPAKYLLDRTTSVHEAEQSHLILTKYHPEPVPFGALHDEWNKMKAKMKPGDELRYFRTAVCLGIARIHNKRIVDFIGYEWVNEEPS